MTQTTHTLGSSKTALNVLRASFAGLAVVALSACGGSSDTGSTSAPENSAPASSAPASSAPAESSAPASSAPAESSAPASSAPASQAAGLTACKALTPEELSTALGVKITDGKETKLGPASMCSYSGGSDAPIIVSQTQALTGGSFDAFKQAVAGQMTEVKESKVEISGAENAMVLSGKLSGSATSAVVVEHNGQFSQILVSVVSGSVPDQAKLTKAGQAMVG